MGLLEMLAGARYSDDPEQNQAINMGLLSAGIAALQSKGGRKGWTDALANFAGGGLQGYGAAQQGFQAKRAADIDNRLKQAHIDLYGAQTEDTRAQAILRKAQEERDRAMENIRQEALKALRGGAPADAASSPYAVQMAGPPPSAQTDPSIGDVQVRPLASPSRLEGAPIVGSPAPTPTDWFGANAPLNATPIPPRGTMPSPISSRDVVPSPRMPAPAPAPPLTAGMTGSTGNPVLDELLANHRQSVYAELQTAKPEDIGKVLAKLQQPLTFDPGKGVLTPSGRGFTMPMQVPGIGHDFVSGRASEIPGFAQANARIKGMENSAVEAAKAAVDLATIEQKEYLKGIGGARGGVATPVTIPQGSNPARVTTQAELADETLQRQAATQFKRDVPPAERERMLADDRAGRPTEYRVPPQGAPGPQGQQARPGDIGSVSPPQQVAGETDLVKQVVQDYTAIQHSGNRAQDSIARLQVLGNALDKIETGKWTDVKRDAVAALEGLGIKLPGGSEFVGRAQFAEVLSRQIALEANKAAEDGGKALPGAMAIWETKMIMDIVPTITKVKNGNRMLLDMMTEIEQRKHGVAAVARAYQQQYGMNPDMAVAIEQYKRAHPFKFTQPGWVK